MPYTSLAARSRIPTLRSKGKGPSSTAARAPLAEESQNAGALPKKRDSGTLSSNSHASPNPKARKILRTDYNAVNQLEKRPRAGSPPPPPSARKRPRKSNQIPDDDFVPNVPMRNPAITTPRRVTRQSLAAEQEEAEADDPMDCLTGPGAQDTRGDSLQPLSRARSATGFDFTMDGSRLMDGLDEDISSGGLYSDLDENENEQAETSIARTAGMSSVKKTPKNSFTPRTVPSPRSKPRASASRQASTTPRRLSTTSRRKSKSPNISRRNSASTTRQTSATPRRQPTTPTPRRQTEPKTLPAPVLTPTAAQLRKEARLAAAQAEAEAKLRESLESDPGGLSVVGEEEEDQEEEEVVGETAEPEGEGVALGGDRDGWEDGETEVENSDDDPLATAPVYRSPTPPAHINASRVSRTWAADTPRDKSNRKMSIGNSSRKVTPRKKLNTTLTQSSTSAARVRWTPRSSSGRTARPQVESEYENEDEDVDDAGDYISSRTRSVSRRSSSGNTPASANASLGRRADTQIQGDESDAAETSQEYGAKVVTSESLERDRSGYRSANVSVTQRTPTLRDGLESRRQSRSTSRGSPVRRERQSTGDVTVRRSNTSGSTSRERDSISSRANLSTISRRDSSVRENLATPKPSAKQSPTRLEVVLPLPRHRPSLAGVRRLAPAETSISTVVSHLPTPDLSSLDRSPALDGTTSGSSEVGEQRNLHHQASSIHNAQADPSSFEQPKDTIYQGTRNSASASFSYSKKLVLSHSTRGDNSISFRPSRNDSRMSGRKQSENRSVLSVRQSQRSILDYLDENASVRDTLEATEHVDTHLSDQVDSTVFDVQRSFLDTPAPQTSFQSTPHPTLDSQVESSFKRFGSYAKSTPYVRNGRQSSFGRLDQHDKSILGEDESSAGELADRIPYSAKGKAREDDEDDDIEEFIPESSQPPDPSHARDPSIDSSIAVPLSSPTRSLRTERVPTPRAARVSDVIGSDDDEDDRPPSPSEGRQSFSGRMKGLKLSEILKLRDQSHSGPNQSQDLSRNEMTTRLDDSAQSVLRTSLTHGESFRARALIPTTRVDSNEALEPLATETAAETSLEDDLEQPSATYTQADGVSEDDEERAGETDLEDDPSVDNLGTQHSNSHHIVQDYDASVHFNGPPRASLRRSGTPILRGQHLADEDNDLDDLDKSADSDRIQRGRSTSISADSSQPDESEQPDYIDVDGFGEDLDAPFPSRIIGSTPAIRRQGGPLQVATGQRGSKKFISSPSSSARSTSRSLSRPRDTYFPRHASVSDRSNFIGDRTAGVSRSQIMAEASRYEDWEPPARRQLRPRKWTDHDWRMLAHYLRRVQKSQALAKGLSSREELDLMVVNVHAVVNRFVEEEAHGIRLEGEWARPEITGRAVYLLIKEQHKKDGTWKSTALNDPGFSTILSDMTRPHFPSEGPEHEEDPSEKRILPAALAELPGPSRAAASQLMSGSGQNSGGDESDGYISDIPDAVPDESNEESRGLPTRIQEQPSRIQQPNSKRSSRPSPKRSPRRQEPQVVAARQRVEERHGLRFPENLTVSDYSSVQVNQTDPSATSTSFSRLIGSISSYISGRSQPQLSESSTEFRKLKPVSRNPIDLTHVDDEEQPSFPTLNHVPTPARPTPARPKRQKHVEPKLDLPTLQHVSPSRPAERLRSPRKKGMRRVASVRELAQSFEKIGEDNRKEAEAARNRIGYGRSVSGPVGGNRPQGDESTGLTDSSSSGVRATNTRAKHSEAHKNRVPKDEIEIIEVSDSSLAVRESVDL